MSGPNYTIIPNDWSNLEYIINDLSRIINEDTAFTDYLLKDGSRALTANWDVGAFSITALKFISDVVAGTSPYACTSTTLNTNLNADLLDGNHSSAFERSITKYDLTGTTNQISLSASGVGVLFARNITLSLPQNIHTGASPTFANITDSGLTITRIPYASTAGLLIDSTNLTFDGTNLTCLGNIGLGISATDYIICKIDKTFSTSSITAPVIAAIGGGLTNTYYTGSSPSSIFALNFDASWIPAGEATGPRTMSVLQGISIKLKVDTSADTVTGIKNYTVTTSKGFEPSITLIKGSGSGTHKITNLYEYTTKNPSITGTFQITTLYGFYDPGLTAGGTNWGLGINTQSYINANLSVGKNTAPTVPLDVVGAVLNTTTIEAGTGFRCGESAAIVDGTYTVGARLTPVTGTDGTITVKGGIITAIQQAT